MKCILDKFSAVYYISAVTMVNIYNFSFLYHKSMSEFYLQIYSYISIPVIEDIFIK